MDYVLHILILIGIYAILAASLNLLTGYTGILSIAHAAFYGVGAYAAALAAVKLGWPFLPCAAFAVVVCGAFGGLVGFPSLRVRGEYFVIATFAFQVIVFSVLNNWTRLTGGPMGIPGIPRPAVLGARVSSTWSFLVLVSAFCATSLWVTSRIAGSAFGRVLKAIREDEAFALSAGKRVGGFKVLVFVASACMAGSAGVLHAYYISYIDPTSFNLMESILIISMVIIGGAGSRWGPVVGAALLVVLPEALRFVGLPGPVAANIRQIIYGGIIVVMMLWRPKGIWGEYAFQRGSTGKGYV